MVSPVCRSRPARGLLAVLGAEGAEVGGIAEPRPRGCLDLDRQQGLARLDNEVHFFAERGAPVEDIGVVEPRIAPSQQIVQDDVFEVRAAWLDTLGEMERDSGVGPVELGRLDEALGAVDGKGGDPDQQVRRFEQVEIAAHRRLRQGYVTAKLGLVDELAEPVARGPH